jgi:hypothetical protein
MEGEQRGGHLVSHDVKDVWLFGGHLGEALALA